MAYANRIQPYERVHVRFIIATQFVINFHDVPRGKRDMTIYQDRHEFYDGAVVVFKRADARVPIEKRFWQARLKIDGRTGFQTISLKTRNFEDAASRAKAMFLEKTQLVRDGASIDNRTFRKAWKEWFAFMIREKAWTPSRQRYHLDSFNRFWNPYFGDKKINSINDENANAYWSWRREYWLTGDGANKPYNRQRNAVAYKTLAIEASALNAFFTWCLQRKRYIRFPVKFKVIVSKRGKDSKRATFTRDEWNVLEKNLLQWANGTGMYSNDRINEYHRHHRNQLRYYIEFLALTGIRSGTETRGMRWGDIEFVSSSDRPRRQQRPRPAAPAALLLANDPLLHHSRQPQYDDDEVMEPHLRIHIRKETKTGRSRTVISQPEAYALMKEWHAISHHNGPNDLVWYGASKEGKPQQPYLDPNRTFQSFLKTVEYQGRPDGLLFDSEKGRRSCYSTRHYYITQRLLNNVSYSDLCRQCGTSTEYLVKTYDRVLTEQRAKEITQIKRRKN